MNIRWVMVGLVALAAISLLRVISRWRSFAQAKTADWDEQFIAQLRRAGINAFEDQTVDFFFTLPNERAVEAVRFALGQEGFDLISQAAVDGGLFSLNLQKRMRINVPDMQALSARLRPLAAQNGGTYDNWAIAREPTV